MVKTIIVTCFVLLLAVPALAQDDYPKIQTSLGYANLSFPDLSTGLITHHSGFANSTGLNLTKTLGVENYMGLYSLGTGSTLIADFIGGKATYRAAKIAPYGFAGLGFSYLTAASNGFYAAQSAFATRYGGGVDVPINDIISWRVEYSRMNFHIQLNPLSSSSWTSGNNIQGGIVFTLVN
jgi:Outer membrane protein beta-barrel domain